MCVSQLKIFRICFFDYKKYIFIPALVKSLRLYSINSMKRSSSSSSSSSSKKAKTTSNNCKYEFNSEHDDYDSSEYLCDDNWIPDCRCPANTHEMSITPTLYLPTTQHTHEYSFQFRHFNIKDTCMCDDITGRLLYTTNGKGEPVQVESLRALRFDRDSTSSLNS